jgi:hypothetical protein
MTPAARRATETLAALGFTRDEERSTRSHAVWTHPADRRQPVKVWSGLKDQTAQLIIRRAEQIAGLSTTETPDLSAKDRQRERRRAEKAAKVAAMIAHDRQLAPFQAAADQRAAEKKRREVLRQRSQLIERWQDAREQLARTQQCGHDTRRAVEAVNEARQAIYRFDSEHRP